MEFPVRIKKEPRQLLSKAVESLMLSTELFNRHSDNARGHSVIMFVDHSFEMLLKSSILHKGGSIHDPGGRNSISFKTAFGRALSDQKVKFLEEGEAFALQAVNDLRDAAQHYLVDICEEHLFLHVQNGVTVFADIVRRVFAFELALLMPRRVLPVSTVGFNSVDVLFANQVNEVRKLLQPGKRRYQEAIAAIRPIAILESSLTGSEGQPSPRELKRLATGIRQGKTWSDLFPGIASIECVPDASSAGIALRITKKEGIAVHVVPEGTPGAGALAIRRVNEDGFYNLTTAQMHKKLGITQPRFVALSRHLKLEADSDCFKLATLGKVHQKKYSQSALKKCQECLDTITAEELALIWEKHRPGKAN
jgi:hypothetical protein